MPQTASFFLANKVDGDIGYFLHHFQQIIFPLGAQLLFQFQGAVEVILDGSLIAAGDDEDLLNPRRDSLFHDKLNGRLIHDGQHFFRLCFRRRKKARP